MSNKPKVAVVILNWNGKNFLEQFLPGVVQHSTYENTEIVLADNASTDDSVAWTKQNCPSVSIVSNQTNYGFAGGYNEALKKVVADYYLLLNQDVEVTPGWLEPLMQLITSNANLAAVQPKIKAFHDKSKFEYAGAAGGMIDWLGYPFCRGRLFDETETDTGQYDDEVDIFWATGACMLVNTKLYWKAGGLDADFFAHMEEIDLCWRLQNMGYRIRYCPASTVYHVGGGSLPQGNPRKTYLNYRNNLAMMYKNLPFLKAMSTIYIRLLLDGVSGLRELLKGKFSTVWAIIRAHWAFFFSSGALYQKRQTIQQKPLKSLKGSYRQSIIWQHFIKGVKQYSKLPK